VEVATLSPNFKFWPLLFQDQGLDGEKCIFLATILDRLGLLVMSARLGWHR
jgi:hypothetical protein